MRRSGVVLLSVALLLVPLVARAEEEKLRYQLRASATYETGDFGTSEKTNTLFVPFTFRYLGDSFDLGITIPFIWQETSGAVSAIEGRPVQIRGEEEVVEGRRAREIKREEAGLGDVVLKGHYYLTEDREGIPAISPFLKLKFPTADEDKGLGTGEFDFGFGVELDKKLGRVGLFADLGYTIIGDPPGDNLRNRFSYGFGASYDFTDELTGSAGFDGSTALVRGRPNPLDLFFQLTYRVTRAASVFGGLSFGLTNGSPDFGISAGTSYKF